MVEKIVVDYTKLGTDEEVYVAHINVICDDGSI